jgi:hypothetical protein
VEPDEEQSHPNAHQVSWISSNNVTSGWVAQTSKVKQRMLFAVYSSMLGLDGLPPNGRQWLDSSIFAPAPPPELYVDVEEDVDDDGAGTDSQGKPKSFPRTDMGFERTIAKIKRRIIRQERLRSIMINKCLARFPHIDQQRFRADPDHLEWLKGHPWLHPLGQAPVTKSVVLLSAAPSPTAEEMSTLTGGQSSSAEGQSSSGGLPQPPEGGDGNLDGATEEGSGNEVDGGADGEEQ